MLKGLRFQKSIRLPLGIRINLSKTGIGWSAGALGLRVGTNAKGKKYTSANLPGSGLTYRKFSDDAPAASGNLVSKILRKLGL
jgi:hypothetical protein